MPRIVRGSALKAVKVGPSRRGVPLPQFIPPQLSQLVASPPAGPQWLHEIKLDGYRTGIPREQRWVPSSEVPRSFNEQQGRKRSAARNRSRRPLFARQSNRPNLSLFGIDSANTIPEHSP
jgi:hypothetical protein